MAIGMVDQLSRAGASALDCKLKSTSECHCESVCKWYRACWIAGGCVLQNFRTESAILQVGSGPSSTGNGMHPSLLGVYTGPLQISRLPCSSHCT